MTNQLTNVNKKVKKYSIKTNLHVPSSVLEFNALFPKINITVPFICCPHIFQCP